MNDKIKDLLDSAKGEIGDILLEEVAPSVAEEAAKQMLQGAAVEVASQAAGLVIPGVGNMILSYKQKKNGKKYRKIS